MVCVYGLPVIQTIIEELDSLFYAKVSNIAPFREQPKGVFSDLVLQVSSATDNGW